MARASEDPSGGGSEPGDGIYSYTPAQSRDALKANKLTVKVERDRVHSLQDQLRGVQASVAEELDERKAAEAQAERERRAREAKIAQLRVEAAEMFKACLAPLRDAQVPTQRFYLETVGKPPPPPKPPLGGRSLSGPSNYKPRVTYPPWYISPRAPTMEGWDLGWCALLIDGSLRRGGTLPLGKKQRRDKEQTATFAGERVELVPCPLLNHPLHLTFPSKEQDGDTGAWYAVCGGFLDEWCLKAVRRRIEEHLKS